VTWPLDVMRISVLRILTCLGKNYTPADRPLQSTQLSHGVTRQAPRCEFNTMRGKIVKARSREHRPRTNGLTKERKMNYSSSRSGCYANCRPAMRGR
jgi:hypothetical protein